MATSAPEAPVAAATRPERIGLIFVHGIGRQKRFEHLTQSVSQIGELMNRKTARLVNVVDRTPDWKLPVDEPSAGGVAPVTMTVTELGKAHVFECHEVFWADLGDPSGLQNTIAFWWWALGQWCAPIYGANDAAQLEKAFTDVKGGRSTVPVSQLARLPHSVSAHFWAEVLARLGLAAAGLAALFSLVGWTLFKRLFSAALQTTPSPSIIVDYVDKVRCYEDRAHPGGTALSDPGFPRRVGIRRRMVAQMVAMGARADIDRWYVLAHSLGSVVAYNGLGEIGHTLPNYLSAAQWRGLPGRLKRDPGCQLRGADEIGAMMPARPAWLADEDVINRPALFARLRGFVTYGSPLEKFAAIWPRIVATATDRKNDGGQPNSAFPKACTWINLRAPLDPVAGGLKSFGAVEMRRDLGTGRKSISAPFFGDFFPHPRTYTTAPMQPYLLAHLDYFKNTEAYVKDDATKLREDIVDWLIDPATEITPIGVMDWSRSLVAAIVSFSLIGLLALVATATIVGVGSVGQHLLTTASGTAPMGVVKAIEGAATKLVCAIRHSFVRSLCGALAVLLLAGLSRWIGESWSDWRLLKASAPKDNGVDDTVRTMARHDDLHATVRLQSCQLVASLVSLLISIVVIAVAGFAGGWLLLARIGALLVGAIGVQAMINWSPEGVKLISSVGLNLLQTPFMLSISQRRPVLRAFPMALRKRCGA